MAAKVKALQQWCKVHCDGYRDVSVTNLTSSWKSGLAFCAVLHRFRPDLIDYDSLSKENVYENNKLAFDVALDHLGIPALLDAEDMVAMAVPDKLCIVTYVSQYANYFRDKKPMGGPGVTAYKRYAVKRPSTAPESTNAPNTKRPSSDNGLQNDKQKSSAVLTVPATPTNLTRRGTYGDTCLICSGKVYLLERHIDNNQLYHRRCFREQQRSSFESKRSSIASNDGSTGGAPASATTITNGLQKKHEQCTEDISPKGAIAQLGAQARSMSPSNHIQDTAHRPLPSSYLPSKFSYLSGGRTDYQPTKSVLQSQNHIGRVPSPRPEARKISRTSPVVRSGAGTKSYASPSSVLLQNRVGRTSNRNSTTQLSNVSLTSTSSSKKPLTSAPASSDNLTFTSSSRKPQPLKERFVTVGSPATSDVAANSVTTPRAPATSAAAKPLFSPKGPKKYVPYTQRPKTASTVIQPTWNTTNSVTKKKKVPTATLR